VIDMKWSKVYETDLGIYAQNLISENTKKYGLEYHNMDHIVSMYDYLDKTNEPYDEALDWAVLFHDIVYDDQPKKEWRSSLEFSKSSKEYCGCSLSLYDISKVSGLIMMTEKHCLESKNLDRTYSAIIRADLHQLGDRVKAFTNYYKIMQESMNLYNVDEVAFAQANLDFMNGLYQRVGENYYKYDRDYQEFHKSVGDGVLMTINLSETLLGLTTHM